MVRVKHCFLFISVILCAGGVWSTQFGYVPVPNAGGWLHLHSAPATWSDALLLCTLEGGDLASPSSGAVLSAMKSIMAQKHIGEVFVGIHEALFEPRFESLDGVPFTEMPVTWAKGQPDDKDKNQQCLAMTQAGELADESCSSVFRYFCYKKYHSEHVITNSTCNTSDKEYKMDRRTGSCYKFHQDSSRWSEAAAVCRSERAHLAVINSQTEAIILSELFSEHPVDTLKGVTNPDMILVGFRMEYGTWLTIFDQSLEEAGYARWGPDEPNNMNENEYCGTMHRYGQLNDFPCDMEAVFICEMTH